MNEVISYAEAFQDIFVLKCFKYKKNGTFLEIGAGDPIKGSNTYLLEKEYNWKGLSMDYGYVEWSDDVIITCNGMNFSRSNYHSYWIKEWNKHRTTPLLMDDALSCDWLSIIHNNFPTLSNKKPTIDYLQVDIDPAENTWECLNKIPFDSVDFNVITYEHDAYKEGDEWRKKSRKYLESKGFILVAGNISSYGYRPYEDWWVSVKYIKEISNFIKFNTFENKLPSESYVKSIKC